MSDKPVSPSAEELLIPDAVRPSLTVNIPLPDGHEVYSLIGRVASAWSQLEHELDRIIWRLAGTTEPKGSCVTSQLMGHAPRYRVIVALLKLSKLDTELTKTAGKQMQKTFEIAERRNRIVHDPWYPGYDYDDQHPEGFHTAHQFRSASSKDPKFGPTGQIDLKEIQQVIAGIVKHQRDVTALSIAINAALAASLEKQPEPLTPSSPQSGR